MISINQRYGTIDVSYFNKEGDIEIENIHIPHEEMFEWVVARPDKHHPRVKSWDGRAVKQQRTKFLSKWRVQEFLQNQPQVIKDKIFQMNKPKKFFIDIEVKVDGEWPTPSLAKQEITTISFAHKNILAVLGTKPLNPAQIEKIGNDINAYLAKHEYPPMKFSYVYFKSEYDLMYTFFNKYMQKMPLMTGWNFIQFDWQYMINRCKRLGIDPGVASGTGELVGRQELPVHRLVVDYLEIYKKWDRIIFKENNTLGYVSKAATGMTKIPYNGTLQDLYESDFANYVYYNAIDSVLVQLIDLEISTMSAYLQLGGITKTELYKVFSPIAITENVMCREFFNNNLVIPKEDRRITRGSYEGAFVFPPKKDLYEWVASFDFASLYPSIMRQWNMSPESFIRKDKTKNENPNYAQAVNGVIFDNSKDSVFKTILTDFYGQRKTAKKTGMEIEVEIEKLKKMLI